MIPSDYNVSIARLSASVAVKQHWGIYVNKSHGTLGANITIKTKHNTAKLCVYFMWNTIHVSHIYNRNTHSCWQTPQSLSTDWHRYKIQDSIIFIGITQTMASFTIATQEKIQTCNSHNKEHKYTMIHSGCIWISPFSLSEYIVEMYLQKYDITPGGQ